VNQAIGDWLNGLWLNRLFLWLFYKYLFLFRLWLLSDDPRASRIRILSLDGLINPRK
jgi:hypothetical protein